VLPHATHNATSQEKVVEPEPITASEMGRRGGCARAAKMTPEQRSASARLAAIARWKKYKRKSGGKSPRKPN